MPARILENAVIRLLKRRPFYGQFLLNFHREPAAGSHPLGVTIRNGTPVLLVNHHRFESLRNGEQEALLEHGVKHLLHLHMMRRKGRNGHDWDIACDLAINPGIAGLPPEAVQPGWFGHPDGLCAEEYYRLARAPFDTGSMAGEGAGTDLRDSQGAAGAGEDQPLCSSAVTADDHSIWAEAESTPPSLAEEVVRGMAREARRCSDGEVPADIRTVVDALLAPQSIPWPQVLRQFVATAGRVGRRSSWLREHRRFSHYTPGIRKRHRLNLLVGVDVSDSTNSTELREAFARELMRIASGRDARITIAYANSRIQRIEAFAGDAASYHGGGFTDLRPLFEYAKTLYPLPAAVIYLTDGIGPAPEHMELPTLWVLSKAGEKPVPWGIELRLDV